MVHWARLELARDYSHHPLKMACLPIPPPVLKTQIIAKLRFLSNNLAYQNP